MSGSRRQRPKLGDPHTFPARDQNPPVKSRLRDAVTQLARLAEMQKSLGAMSEGVQLLLDINCFVQCLDPKRRTQVPGKREFKRRKPWLAFKDIESVIPDLKLTSTVSQFVSVCCRYLGASKSRDPLSRYDSNDLNRLKELAIAANVDNLLRSVHIDDPDRLAKYCDPALAKLYAAGAGRRPKNDWQGWAVSMFHDIWSRHRFLDGNVPLVFVYLKMFVEETEHEKFVCQLRKAAPTATRPLEEIQKERRRRDKQERRKT